MNSTRYMTPADATIGRCDAVAISADIGPAAPAARVPLRFAAFGRFRAELAGCPVPLPPITTTMLARLLLARGGLVDADHLYQDVWPEPVFAVKREQRVAVHKRIAELRRYLDMEQCGVGRSVLLTDRAARTGYRLVASSDQVDVFEFEDLICRAAATQDGVAVDLLTQALSLWTERPLVGLPDRDFVRDAVARLVALRDRACRELATVCRVLDRRRDARAVFDRLQANQPGDRGLNRLIDQLRGELDQTPGASVAVRSPGALPTVWNVPLRIPDCVSRPGLLARVREQLARGPVALVGPLGVGKSRLAVEYAHQFAHRYGLVWWLDARHGNLVDAQLAAAAAQAGVAGPEIPVPVAAAKMRQHVRTLADNRTLLIFDNVADPERVRPWLPEHGHVLITSRHPGWAETATPLVVTELARAESVSLLASRLPWLCGADAERLAHELGDLPLALAQAANLIGAGSMTVADFLDDLAAHPTTVAGQGSVASYPMSLADAVQAALEVLAGTDPGAADVLGMYARSSLVETAPSGRTDRAGALPPGERATLRRRLSLIGQSGLARVEAGEVAINRFIRAILLDPSHPTLSSAPDRRRPQ
jgi:DNA-binding SARP family transcriptional activator